MKKIRLLFAMLFASAALTACQGSITAPDDCDAETAEEACTIVPNPNS